MDDDHQSRKMQGYMEALEEEKRKIQVFQRELPLCLELVNQAIESCRQQLSGTTTEYMQGGQSQCSEQTSTDGPVLEEFIPIKRVCSASDEEEEEEEDDDDDDDEQHSHKNPKSDHATDKKKSDWLRSAQLWNQTAPAPPLQQESTPRRVSVVEVTRNGGAFQPFLRENKSPVKTTSHDNTNYQNNNDDNNNNQAFVELHSPVPVAATSSTADTTKGNGNGSRKEEKEGQAQRKQRRCWSPELHRRFLQALQQLGGSHAATPKQIRELMKVDGLTNDEVKSHLQKYRLHTRRPSPTIQHNGSSQAPQFVVVGGIWVQPPEYAAVAASATTASGEAAKPPAASAGVYAPLAIAAAPQQRNQSKDHSPSHSEGRGSHSAGDAHSKSPSTSSSTHTAASSPVD
ncbi:transcription factor HHO2-like [Rhodamnia argentea]|uniref:Transcription factor HHO2-like n=1 Tax=Rhodamnia argentea TaxID=178133 RepID=A0A8B8QNM9_9MYRT|nr:transcription factor HHO2-like [Rhodamnia argentea]